MLIQSSDTINICIVDDHPFVRSGIRRLLESFPHIKINFEATNGSDFLQKLNSSNLPHILILDIIMPEMNGYELLPILERDFPEIKPIVLSMVSGEDAILHLLSIGACACINKSSGIDILIEVIEEVFVNGIYKSNLKVTSSVSKKRKSLDKRGFYGQSPLTQRESLILPLLASELSYAEIANNESLEEKTIQNYRDRIYAKLGIKSRNELTLYAIKNGLFNPFN